LFLRSGGFPEKTIGLITHCVLLPMLSIDTFLMQEKKCPKLNSEQQGQVNQILQFSQLPKNAERMLFRNIVIDSALREYLGYQIPIDKVAWDHQGNLKKPYLPSERVVSGLHAGPPSMKSRAHKNISTLSKSIVDPKSEMWLSGHLPTVIC
jgi:hypothetical protein